VAAGLARDSSGLGLSNRERARTNRRSAKIVGVGWSEPGHFMDAHGCLFCRLEKRRIRFDSKCAVAILDRFPVAEGHTLVIPTRHVASLFELSEEEQAAVWGFVAMVRAKLAADFRPDGFNIGLNDGISAGQTVMHAHIHVIPRRDGDVTDPRGGVRWVVPDKAPYWGETWK
jgi:diadenosine tetraphosphate (Ap4A) HIT family hydrolase